MLNIESILKFILANLAHTGRFSIIDDEHVLDNKTGVKLHLYDGWFKITREDKIIVVMNELTPTEQKIVWEIKNKITKPEDAETKQANYLREVKEKRELLSSLFEKPQSVVDLTPAIEQGTAVYTG